ncbi:MAG TPA: formimidoylglutamase [Salinimicrobium sp.]|nr:formimidoylglutamase [Salinimicrobium sp.]
MLNFEFLSPVDDKLIDDLKTGHHQSIGSNMKVHTQKLGAPELDGIKIAVVGVLEARLAVQPTAHHFDFFEIRKHLYKLFPGNWDLSIADLGDLKQGDTVEDTYYALQHIVSELIKLNIIPVIIGGSQDLIYAQYRAYDNLDQMVNLVNIDHQFDLGDAEQPISNKSYLGKIVVTEPYNLFNCSNIGFQTYYNSQDEIDLMDKLYFDSFRLGEVTTNITAVEPVLRNANLVGIDLGAISNSAYPMSANGFNGREICALARYAGISDKVSSIGIYEYQQFNMEPTYPMLIAQIIWYFIEGVNFRKNEYTISAKKEFIKYNVPVEEEILTFYKSPNSGRWWIEIPYIENLDNKLKRNTLLPCTEDDYLHACNQIIPERWFKAKRKNEIL